jgi:broad specificity phosphatase PhoE
VERVILVRHGEADHNPPGRVNGDPARPVHLTERGRSDAAALGRDLADEEIDLCVVTEFARTHETADAALAGRSIPRLVVPELNDPRFGDLEWHPVEEIRSHIAEHGPTARLPGGGEARVETIRRYCDGFELVEARPERTVLVVAHGLPVTVVWMAARGERVPMSLQGVADGYAQALRLDGGQLRIGIERMRDWVREQEAAA